MPSARVAGTGPRERGPGVLSNGSRRLGNGRGRKFLQAGGSGRSSVSGPSGLLLFLHSLDSGLCLLAERFSHRTGGGGSGQLALDCLRRLLSGVKLTLLVLVVLCLGPVDPSSSSSVPSWPSSSPSIITECRPLKVVPVEHIIVCGLAGRSRLSI